MTTPSLTAPPSGPSMASGWACSRETPSPPTPIKSVTHAGVMRETVSHLLTAVGIPLVCTETDAGDRERVLARFLERQLAELSPGAHREDVQSALALLASREQKRQGEKKTYLRQADKALMLRLADRYTRTTGASVDDVASLRERLQASQSEAASLRDELATRNRELEHARTAVTDLRGQLASAQEGAQRAACAEHALRTELSTQAVVVQRQKLLIDALLDGRSMEAAEALLTHATPVDGRSRPTM